MGRDNVIHLKQQEWLYHELRTTVRKLMEKVQKLNYVAPSPLSEPIQMQRRRRKRKRFE